MDDAGPSAMVVEAVEKCFTLAMLHIDIDEVSGTPLCPPQTRRPLPQ